MSYTSTYLKFATETDEAFNFYKSIFGGEFEGLIHRFNEIPDIPEVDKSLIMHIMLPILGGHKLIGADTPSIMREGLIIGDSISISLHPDTQDEAQRIFSGLMEGGVIEIPIIETPWGVLFGSGRDKYGVEWRVSYEYNQNSILIENLNSYIHTLGLFWQNFNNLEIFLRLYLNWKSGSNNIEALGWLEKDIGFELEENSITDWKSFEKLCDVFNEYQPDAEKINFDEIKKLRDALAHGRVMGDDNANMTLVKYTRPVSGKVKIEYKRIVSPYDTKILCDKIASIGKEITFRMGAKNIT